MKIKSVIKKEETIEKEISLPYFCKYFDSITEKYIYFKVISENAMIEVMTGGYKSISRYSPSSNTHKLSIAEEVGEFEFNEQFFLVKHELEKDVEMIFQ